MATINGNIESKVAAYLSNPKNSIFKWGEKDCAFFANDMLVEVFGLEDVGAQFRGKYATEIGAAKTLFKLGYKNITDVVKEQLTELDKPQVGAIALHPQLDALGVCNGDYSYFIQQHGGFKKVLSSKCRKFWGVVCQQ